MNPFEQALERYLSQEQLIKIRAVKVRIAGAGGFDFGSRIGNRRRIGGYE